jgi:hypothetical protein
MGQVSPKISDRVNDWPDARLGVSASAAAAFRAVAARRAPGLAQLYAETFTGAYLAGGVAIAPPAWPTRWPEAWVTRLSWRDAKALSVEALASVHPHLGARAGALIAMGRALSAAPHGAFAKPSRFGPPWVRVAFDGSSEAAVTLAHELGHAAQMWGGLTGASRPAPAVAAAETAAHVAECSFHDVFTVWAGPRAGFARRADDVVAMLVRHPARDALEQAGLSAWGAIAAAYAPGLDWAGGTPPLTARGMAEPGTTLAYAMAAALALVVAETLTIDPAFKDTYLAWNDGAERANIDTLCAALGHTPESLPLWERGYDLAARALHA